MYTAIYTHTAPEILEELTSTQAMQRLDNISMHCGCDWAGFSIYKNARGSYSRLTHSIGVAEIIWNFTHDINQAAAGLFHDISTPAFAHSIDFLNGDYMEQESTEDDTREFICNSEEIMAILKKYGIDIADVSDYHRYPIADNDTPMLSADRLEYTLGDGYFLHHMGIREIEAIYRDLTVVKNEHEVEELCFRSLEYARQFTELSLLNSHLFVSDEDRFAMQYVSEIVGRALEKGVLQKEDLATTESAVVAKMEKDSEISELWQRYTSVSKVIAGTEKRQDQYCVNIEAKKRYINPLVITEKGIRRISEVEVEIGTKMNAFLSLDFNKWIYAG